MPRPRPMRTARLIRHSPPLERLPPPRKPLSRVLVNWAAGPLKRCFASPPGVAPSGKLAATSHALAAPARNTNIATAPPCKPHRLACPQMAGIRIRVHQPPPDQGLLRTWVPNWRLTWVKPRKERFPSADTRRAKMAGHCLGKPGGPRCSGTDNRLLFEAVLAIAPMGSPWHGHPGLSGTWNTIVMRYCDWF